MADRILVASDLQDHSKSMIFISYHKAHRPLLGNLSFISHRFRDKATYSLKLSTENCGKTAADGDMVTIAI